MPGRMSVLVNKAVLGRAVLRVLVLTAMSCELSVLVLTAVSCQCLCLPL